MSMYIYVFIFHTLILRIFVICDEAPPEAKPEGEKAESIGPDEKDIRISVLQQAVSRQQAVIRRLTAGLEASGQNAEKCKFGFVRLNLFCKVQLATNRGCPD